MVQQLHLVANQKITSLVHHLGCCMAAFRENIQLLTSEKSFSSAFLIADSAIQFLSTYLGFTPGRCEHVTHYYFASAMLQHECLGTYPSSSADDEDHFPSVACTEAEEGVFSFFCSFLNPDTTSYLLSRCRYIMSQSENSLCNDRSSRAHA